MENRKKFINPVYAAGGSALVSVGGTVTFILKDGSEQVETLTYVSDDGRTVGWETSVNGTRDEDVRAVSAIHQKDCALYGGAQNPDPV